jgi:hypothetical protein
MYKTLKITYLIPLLLLWQCQTLTTGTPPGNVIEPGAFKQILSDIEKAEAYIHMQYAKQNRLKPEEVYLAVFAKHHITKSRFDSSLTYYANHPEYLEKSYNEILEEITKEQAAISAKLNAGQENQEEH